MNKIKDLKIMSIAYQIANNYDYCQSEDQVETLCDEFKFTKDDILIACREYQGCRPDEVANRITSLIDKL